MKTNEKVIYVFATWLEDNPTLIGVLSSSVIKGEEFFSFEFDEDFLKNHSKSIGILDPDLFYFKGRQYSDKNLFGMFTDSCPDRFGRMLMNRREVILAKKEGRKPNKLNESDYLLGVQDRTRIGGLRFSLDKGETFLSNNNDISIPPMTSLRTLENACLALETEKNENVEKWLKILIAPGSSLGGARPKANVVDTNGELWIAKFPSKHDEYDCGIWEMVAHDLAKMCSINVPEAKIDKFSSFGHTFLVKRFDRDKDKRIHFSSGMNLLNHTDGEKNVSYLEIVSFIKSHGSNPEEDLLELFKRIAFSIAVSNTDDHLRNHGFILDKNGWKLSPMYDVNPNVFGNGLSLNIDENDNSLDFDLLLNTSTYYGLAKNEAEIIIQNIKDIVKNNWKEIAKKYNASRDSINYMQGAFQLTD